MNSTMIRINACRRKRFAEMTTHRDIATVKTIIIGCNRMRGVIVITPGDRGSCRHRNSGRAKGHICHANRVRRGGWVVTIAAF